MSSLAPHGKRNTEYIWTEGCLHRYVFASTCLPSLYSVTSLYIVYWATRTSHVSAYDWRKVFQFIDLFRFSAFHAFDCMAQPCVTWESLAITRAKCLNYYNNNNTNNSVNGMGKPENGCVHLFPIYRLSILFRRKYWIGIYSGVL